jgi:hypothetical protein
LVAMMPSTTPTTRHTLLATRGFLTVVIVP